MSTKCLSTFALNKGVTYGAALEKTIANLSHV